MNGDRLTPEFFNIEAGEDLPWLTVRLAINDGYAGVLYVPEHITVRVNGLVLPRCTGNWQDRGICVIIPLQCISSARAIPLSGNRLDISVGSMFFMPSQTFAAVFESNFPLHPRQFLFKQVELIAGVDLNSLWVYLNYVVSNARPYRTRQDDSYTRSQGVMISSASDVVVLYNNASKFVAAATIYNGRYVVRFHVGTEFRKDFFNIVTRGYSSWFDLYTKYQAHVNAQVDNTWYQKEYVSLYQAAKSMSEFCGCVPKNVLSIFSNISLTMEYSNALTVYTGDGYKLINNGMRTHNIPHTYKQYCLDIITCLNMNSIMDTSKVILWRGVPFVKDIFIDDAFVSTSMVLSVALGFSSTGMVLRLSEMFVVPSYGGTYDRSVIQAFEDTTREMPASMYTRGSISALYLNEISGFRSNTEFEVLVNARCRFELLHQVCTLGGVPVFDARMIQLEQFDIYAPQEVIDFERALGRLLTKSCYLSSNITYTFRKLPDYFEVIFRDQTNKEYFFRSYPDHTEQVLGSSVLWSVLDEIDSIEVVGRLERETEEVRLLGVVTDRAVFCTFYNEILSQLREHEFVITDSDFWVMPVPHNEQTECRFLFRFKAPATDSYLLGVIVTTSYDGYLVCVTQEDVMQGFKFIDKQFKTLDTNKIIAEILRYAVRVFNQDIGARLDYVLSTLRLPNGCLSKTGDKTYRYGVHRVVWDFRAKPGTILVSVDGRGKEFHLMNHDMALVINYIFSVFGGVK